MSTSNRGIPARAGIHGNTGFRIKSGMTIGRSLEHLTRVHVCLMGCIILAAVVSIGCMAGSVMAEHSAAETVAFVRQGDIGAQNRILELKPGSSPRRIITDASEPAGTMPGK